MATLLRIDASSRADASVSRELSDAFVERWQQSHPNGNVIKRDVARYPVEHIREETVTGFYTPKENFTPELATATALSDSLIAELNAADTLVISTPIYNWSVPSALKAWIDQVTRVGVTFGYEPKSGLFGMIEGKKAVVLAAMGLPYQGSPLADFDFLRPYLSKWLNFLGITDVEIVAVEQTSADPEAFTANKQAALKRIEEMVNV